MTERFYHRLVTIQNGQQYAAYYSSKSSFHKNDLFFQAFSNGIFTLARTHLKLRKGPARRWSSLRARRKPFWMSIRSPKPQKLISSRGSWWGKSFLDNCDVLGGKKRRFALPSDPDGRFGSADAKRVQYDTEEPTPSLPRALLFFSLSHFLSLSRCLSADRREVSLFRL